jgi:hypothetical protein
MARILGGALGKIVRITNPSTQRTQSIRMIAGMLREYAGADRKGPDALDMAAFIFSHLKSLSDSIDQTALAWEKRDYWVKADAFRRQWSWVEKPMRALKECLPRKEVTGLESILQDLSRVLPAEKSPPKKPPTLPWPGSWAKIFPES